MAQAKRLFLGLVLLFSAISASADSVVLLHGYLSSARVWHNTGIVMLLHQSGWPFAGHFGPRGVEYNSAGEMAPNRTYTIDLPWSHPVEFQADVLNRFLRQIAARHPGENIILVGHSAGGVVARMALVRRPTPEVSALITIASPHVGTPAAAYALDKTDDPAPISIMKSFFGGKLYRTVRHSHGALVDLLPPSHWNMLGWLNRQPHPPIRYFSVVRYLGDGVVPAFSEDMNQVPALAGRSEVILSPDGHGLNPVDGYVVLQILQRLQLEKQQAAQTDATADGEPTSDTAGEATTQ